MPCVQDATTPGHVLDQVDGLEQLVALAVGLHHRVLDAVVDHLAEVAGAHRAGVHEAGAGHLLAGLVLGRGGLSASKIGWTLATSSAVPPTISA